jgi:hypothetical protein
VAETRYRTERLMELAQEEPLVAETRYRTERLMELAQEEAARG